MRVLVTPMAVAYLKAKVPAGVVDHILPSLRGLQLHESIRPN